MTKKKQCAEKAKQTSFPQRYASAEQALRELARRLGAQRDPRSTVGAALAHWAAAAILAKLDGPEKSLDAAFGLVNKGGRPRKNREALMREVFALRMQGLSWIDVANKLGIDDERELRRQYREAVVPLMAEQIAADLKLEPDDEK